MEDYKNEIVETRKGCLGSSDGKLICSVAKNGIVPKSAYKRLAVLKGLTEHVDIPHTAAVRAGDEIENIIFNHLKQGDERYQSNPMLVSKKFSRKNVKLISHPDFMLVEEGEKVVRLYECKATNKTFERTRMQYIEQLYVHYVLGKEYVEGLGDGWTVKLYLCHYNTSGLNLENGVEFDPSRLTVHQVYFSTMYFDVMRGMNIVNAFLENFTEYYEGDEIDANLLPTNVKSQFDNVAAMLVEIKERESKVEEFKQHLYQFMVDKDIKSIKNDVFSITRVDPTVSKSFDAKKYVADLIKKYPRKSKKIIADYTKETKRKGFASIKVNDNND